MVDTIFGLKTLRDIDLDCNNLEVEHRRFYNRLKIINSFVTQLMINCILILSLGGLLLTVLGFICFMSLYLLKFMCGIDLISGFHLNDIVK